MHVSCLALQFGTVRTSQKKISGGTRHGTVWKQRGNGVETIRKRPENGAERIRKRYRNDTVWYGVWKLYRNGTVLNLLRYVTTRKCTVRYGVEKMPNAAESERKRGENNTETGWKRHKNNAERRPPAQYANTSTRYLCTPEYMCSLKDLHTRW